MDMSQIINVYKLVITISSKHVERVSNSVTPKLQET